FTALSQMVRTRISTAGLSLEEAAKAQGHSACGRRGAHHEQGPRTSIVSSRSREGDAADRDVPGRARGYGYVIDAPVPRPGAVAWGKSTSARAVAFGAGAL